MLTKEQILACDDIQLELVAVPEWGGDVYVKSLTGAERDWLEMSTYEEKKGKDKNINMKNFRAKLVSLSVCDEHKQRLFDEKDIDVLTAKSAAALQRIFEVAQRLSGFTNADADELSKN